MQTLEVVDCREIFNQRSSHFGFHPLIKVQHVLGLLLSVESKPVGERADGLRQRVLPRGVFTVTSPHTPLHTPAPEPGGPGAVNASQVSGLLVEDGHLLVVCVQEPNLEALEKVGSPPCHAGGRLGHCQKGEGWAR